MGRKMLTLKYWFDKTDWQPYEYEPDKEDIIMAVAKELIFQVGGGDIPIDKVAAILKLLDDQFDIQIEEIAESYEEDIKNTLYEKAFAAWEKEEQELAYSRGKGPRFRY